MESIMPFINKGGFTILNDVFKGAEYTSEPIENKNVVLDYMRNKSKPIGYMPMKYKDIFTGEFIKMEACTKSDDRFRWFNVVEYYFDKYNLKLPDEFINHILGKLNRQA